MSTYTPIASLTLSSAQSSVTFNAIPQTYTDLVLVTSVKYTSSEQALALTFNNDSGTNYSATYLYGNGSSATSGRDTNNILIPIARGDDNNFWAGTTNISNYTNTTTFKSVLSRGNSGVYVISYAGLWRNTSAITSLKIAQLTGSSFASGSTFNLYGIANAGITNVAKATGGDTVVTDGTYWYHAFTSSGTFTPTQSINADILVIAGGGGYAAVGSNSYGGGGAGGLIAHTAQSLTATNYTITVGSGGGYIANGNNSQFGSLTASVGGGRGGNYNTNGQNGGSGGGAGSAAVTFGTGTSGQGNNGGAGAGTGNGSGVLGAGGGGAGAVGGNATAGTSAGSGGNGSSAYSSWGLATGTGENISGTRYFAGGGLGIGYLSPNYVVGSNGYGCGIANTGGGGANERAGDSGIVIVRYAV